MPSTQDLILPFDAKVPDHVAIIPDGNRRWARAKGYHTLEGHKAGFKNAVALGRAARDWGIHTVTLWGFSTENWDRTQEEVGYLMKLYGKLISDYLTEAKENKVRIYHIGRKDRIPKQLLNKILQAEKETAKYDKFVMNIAIDYGGQDEIVRAVRGMIKDKRQESEISIEMFNDYLDTKNQPYPYVDMMIRTSGEQRTSGFMLWQSHYNEFYWADCHFPDFGPVEFKKAVLDYSRRRRRFGGNDAIEHLTFRPEISAKLELAWWRLSKIPQGTRLRDFAASYLKEQYGLSKKLAKEAAGHMLEAIKNGDDKDWEKAKRPLKRFYRLIKDHLKLAFEPEILTSLRIRLWKASGSEGLEDVEDIAQSLTAEEYRLSNFQAAKAAHLRVLAEREYNLAKENQKDAHWDLASDYLQRYYRALKERVA